MLNLPTYVLITPARNEAQFIELTIKSVVSQTVRPLKWVIVSDGSTDGTDDIVSKYAAEYPWIELVRMPERRERHFAGKVHAFNAGYGRVRDLEYEVIGNLDGDVSFDDQEFFSSLLWKLAEDPTLGVVGTSFKHGGRYVYDYRFVNIEHVSGPCQLFRRECFEEIGGYVPVKTGGVDVIAVVAARMKGWKTKTFTHTWFQLHREMGAVRGHLMEAPFRSGIKDYTLGNHPMWELLRTAYQMTRRPFVIGGMALACGYVWALIRGAERVVSPEMQAFRRREDMQRLRRVFTAKGNWALQPSSGRARHVCTSLMNLPTYVLVTPARDEAGSIELTIKSVMAQTVRPRKWVIVSDGSTDGTDAIVSRYAAQCPWIELLRVPERSERDFAGKVHAFNAGYARVRDLEYEVIGNLDGDISFDEDYFSLLLGKLAEDSTLGLVGTPFKDRYFQPYDYRFVGIDHVSGACQLFRRACFEEIGGYVAVKGGGVDLIAGITARMKGWKTRTFTDKVCVHHRAVGSAQDGVLKASFKVGVKDYALGAHPIWEFLRVVYQITNRPFLLRGVTLGAGYVWALARRAERPVPREFVAFRRREQMHRLRALLKGSTNSLQGSHATPS
jgi:biofilm PGA synthesis N-glycosyltransferase PgaC